MTLGHKQPAGYQQRMTSARTPQGYAWLRFVTLPSVRDRLLRLAEREDVTLSEILRRAAEAYLKANRL